MNPETLSLTAQTLEALVKNSADLVMRFDRHGRFLSVNPTVEQVTGLPKSAFVGRTSEELGISLVLPADWPHILEDVFVVGQEREIGFSAPTLHGFLDYHSRFVPLCFPDGSVNSVLSITHSKDEQTVSVTPSFFQGAFDSLHAHIAILDQNGITIAVNRAWRRFALENHVFPSYVCEGSDYLGTCESAQGEDAAQAHAVAAGLRAVIQGHREEFLLEYPCHSPSVNRWFLARAIRFMGNTPGYVLVVHEDITEQKRTRDALVASAKKLQALSGRLMAVQEEERRKIARDLHDQIGQILTGLSLTLAIGKRLTGTLLTQNQSQAEELIQDAIARVRRISLELRPAMLDDLGLLPTLLWHFQQFTEQTHIRVDFRHVHVIPRFSPEIETASYRIVQEALTNVARHAGVTEARVRLWTRRGRLHAQIEDHGTGFAVDQALDSYDSSGLTGMQERASLLGGRLQIVSALGAGTCILAEFPITDVLATP